VRLDLNEDQRSLVEGVEGVVGSPGEPERCVESFIYDHRLDAKLAEAGFFELVQNGYSLLDAALVGLTIAKLPTCVEASASLVVKASIPSHYERPLALLRSGQIAPVRYLPLAKTVLIERGEELCALVPAATEAEAVESFFAYPYGRLAASAIARAEPISVQMEVFRARCQLALAIDISGAMQGALDRTVVQVKDRKQFGRPIGAFQAVQHRLATAAQIVAGGRLLTCRAAYSGSAVDAAMALSYLQHHVNQLAYDLHQFSGAMGLTLEYPLHLWTYRMRALVGEYGGANQHARFASGMTWLKADLSAS
jgi:hypothetical protein